MSSVRSALPVPEWMDETRAVWRRSALPGEVVVGPADGRGELMTLVSGGTTEENVQGCLLISNFRLFFHGVSRQYHKSVFYAESAAGPDGAPGAAGFDVDLPLGAVADVRKLSSSNVASARVVGFELVAKDFRPNLRFHFGVGGGKKATEAASAAASAPNGGAGSGGGSGIIAQVQAAVFCEMETLFAFHNKEKFPGAGANDGWCAYRPYAEIERLGLTRNDSGWRVSELNKDYSLVDTYPALLAVPLRTTDEQLRRVAQYRSRGRLPVLSWLHPLHRSALVRSSQPGSGVMGKRCAEDEEMFQAICDTNRNSLKRASHSAGSAGSLASLPGDAPGPGDDAGHYIIFDARPMINAQANRATGGGIENARRYRGSKYKYLDIANIHVMRHSLGALHELVHGTPDDDGWLRQLDRTEWMVHVHRVLDGARRIAHQLERQRRSVLLHCSDGWDRTSQLSSLVMLMLDPFYRTFEGFPVLIEKEWVAAGHKFADRTLQGPNGRDGDEEAAPIFLQFVDATWQLTHQFPHAFQFNADYLIALLDAVFSCRFGTFLFNCERERRDHQVRERTPSLWAHLRASGADGRWANPLYRPTALGISPVLAPRTEVAALAFWHGYYCRWRASKQMRAQHSLSQRLIRFVAEHGVSQGAGAVREVVSAGRRLRTSLKKRGSKADDEEAGEGAQPAPVLLMGLREHEDRQPLIHAHPPVNI